MASIVSAMALNGTAQKVVDHFTSIQTMTGNFIQIGPEGRQINGQFFMSRPGKLRFDYEKPSPIQVISDGRNLVVGNRKLKTWSLYPLGKTPLKLLLSDKIDLFSDTIKSIEETEELTTIVMGNKSIFGDAIITTIFDSRSYELRQWTIKDLQGKNTTVMIFNVQTGVNLSKRTFRIPYYQINPDNNR